MKEVKTWKLKENILLFEKRKTGFDKKSILRMVESSLKKNHENITKMLEQQHKLLTESMGRQYMIFKEAIAQAKNYDQITKAVKMLHNHHSVLLQDVSNIYKELFCHLPE